MMLLDINTTWAQSVLSFTMGDDAGGEQLPGVAIRIKGISTVTFTANNGQVEYQQTAKGFLQLSIIGYDAIEVPVQQTVDVKIKASERSLNDVAEPSKSESIKWFM